MKLEGLYKLKQFNELIRTRAYDLSACSIVPQPSVLQRAPFYHIIYNSMVFLGHKRTIMTGRPPLVGEF
jgi:hypothetical protein